MSTGSTTLSITLVAAATLLLGCGADDPVAGPADTPVPTTTASPDTTEADDPPTTAPTTAAAPDTTAPDTSEPDTTTAPTTEVPMDPDDTQPPASEPTAVAVADLSARTGRDAADIEVALVESVTWSDGSIGCPVEGRSYTQALVPGYRIELVLDGVSYWYHGAGDGDPFWCETPRDPVPGERGDA